MRELVKEEQQEYETKLRNRSALEMEDVDNVEEWKKFQWGIPENAKVCSSECGRKEGCESWDESLKVPIFFSFKFQGNTTTAQFTCITEKSSNTTDDQIGSFPDL